MAHGVGLRGGHQGKAGGGDAVRAMRNMRHTQRCVGAVRSAVARASFISRRA
ncbi:hypothetical protein XCR_1159 [Xanthomonas campestris pv. raphani 756C]|nr:hypothetical protein XCR_1159 [Xanthomonas campestris pv. raphani 756C]